MPAQKTPQEWEDLYLPQLLAFENGLEISLAPLLQPNFLFSNLPYFKQWEWRTYFYQLRYHMELYNPTAEWFLKNNLPRYTYKLNEIKGNIDEVISMIASQMDSQASSPVDQRYGPPPNPVLPNSYAMPPAEQAAYNKKMLEIMQESQKKSFEHFQNMYDIQQKITDTINRY